MRRLGCPILFGGGSSRSTTREGLAPRRRAIVRDLSPYSSQQSRWRGGAAFWACSRASTTALKPPTPRRGACARKSPNLAAELPLPLGAAALALGGASPQRLLRGDGGDAGGDAAQNRARRFGAKRVCPESAALGFPPPAGVAPYPLDQPLRGEAGGCPRWWCCEGRRCRGSLTQIATIGFLIAASASRDRFAPSGLAFGEVSLASLGAFPLAIWYNRKHETDSIIVFGVWGRAPCRLPRLQELRSALRDEPLKAVLKKEAGHDMRRGRLLFS